MPRHLTPIGCFVRTRPRSTLRERALLACILLAGMVLGGCATGPRALQETRLQYNEVVKATTEQQLLLNIVRLRYTDTPSSLSVANIAAQFELVRQLSITPFFVASGAEPNRSYTAVLPQAGVSYADRPTFSFVPIDDAEFTRKLFTPLTLDGVLYLANTTWPIGTVFRLYLENLNWVPNAELASGPTPKAASPFADFVSGVLALAGAAGARADQAVDRGALRTRWRFDSRVPGECGRRHRSSEERLRAAPRRGRPNLDRRQAGPGAGPLRRPCSARQSGAAGIRARLPPQTRSAEIRHHRRRVAALRRQARRPRALR